MDVCNGGWEEEEGEPGIHPSVVSLSFQQSISEALERREDAKTTDGNKAVGRSMASLSLGSWKPLTDSRNSRLFVSNLLTANQDYTKGKVGREVETKGKEEKWAREASVSKGLMKRPVGHRVETATGRY